MKPSTPIFSVSLACLAIAFLIAPLQAEEWKRVSSKDGKISALFPEDIRDNPQTQVDKTAAGKVTSYFGEHYGDGFLLAGSGADIPMLARAAGQNRVFDASGSFKRASGPVASGLVPTSTQSAKPREKPDGS